MKRSPLTRKTPLRSIGKVGRRRAAGMKAAQPVVAERSGGWCEAMFSPHCTHRAVTMHHILERSFGGDESPENLIAICFECHTGHRGIHNRPAEAKARGLYRTTKEIQ